MKQIRDKRVPDILKRKKQGSLGPLAVPLFLVILSLLICAIFIALLGTNPFTAYLNLLQGSGLYPKPKYPGYKSMLTDFMSLLNAWTPMILASLSVTIALKAGLFNIGVSGQMLSAGFLASIFVGYSSLPAIVSKPLVIVVAIIVGGLMGAIVGWLKYRFNINEVVSTIMFNYIAQYTISFFINTYYVNPVSRQSNPVQAAAKLTKSDQLIGNLKMDIPYGIILAIIAVFYIWFLIKYTKAGFEIKAIGTGRKAAKYAGIAVGYRMVMAMIISGALAGLAGVTYYLGYFSSIQPGVLPTTGFDAIAVSLLGANHPFGILASSLLITVINKGSTYMSSASGIFPEMTSVITGIILLFSACSAFIHYILEKSKRKKQNNKKGR